MNKKYVIGESALIDRIKKKELIYVDTLKFTLKYLNIKPLGKKKELLDKLLGFYKEKYYIDNIKTIIFIQKKIKQKFQNKLQKIDFINDEDFYTLDPLGKIPKEFLYYFVDENKYKYGFDIRSLKILIQKSDINPYNRKQIPIDVIEKIKLRIKELKSKQFCLEIEPEQKLTAEQVMNNKIVNIFQEIDSLNITASGTDVNWFKHLSFSKLKRFYRTLEDVWNYRTQITYEQKIKIVPGNNIFRYNMAYIINLDPKYINNLKHLILDEMNKMITLGIDEENRRLGAYYILIGLTEVSLECAQTLPWLTQS